MKDKMRFGWVAALLALALAGGCRGIGGLEMARLDAFAGEFAEKKTNDFGYPVNHNTQLEEFYAWFAESGLGGMTLNNAGDPYDIRAGRLNTLPFEREVVDFFAPHYGFSSNEVWGFVTFIGTDGNNHGIYFGAKHLEKKMGQRPILYVSDAAHYSNLRIADLQNLDVVLVPADVHGRMIPEELDKALVPGRPALVVYAMGTSFKSGIDDQAALNAVLAAHPDIEVYRHVDAALFGCYLPYTEHRAAVDRRVQPFDSIAVSGYKFFGMDEPAGLFLTTREVKESQAPGEASRLPKNMPTINSSRSAVSPLKMWWIVHRTGEAGFAEQAAGMLERAAWLKGRLDAMGWPAWLEPMSNTVYFKRPPAGVVRKYDLAQDRDDRLGGDLSHIVVMQHVTRERLQGFLDDLAAAK